MVVRCLPAAHSLAIAAGGKCFELESGLLQRTVYPRDSELIRHVLLIEARQQKHCRLYDSLKCLEFLTASLLGRQSPIQPIVSLAALGGTAHAGDALLARCAPSSARGRVASVLIWSDNLQKVLLGRNSELVSPNG